MATIHSSMKRVGRIYYFRLGIIVIIITIIMILAKVNRKNGIESDQKKKILLLLSFIYSQ